MHKHWHVYISHYRLIGVYVYIDICCFRKAFLKGMHEYRGIPTVLKIYNLLISEMNFVILY